MTAEDDNIEKNHNEKSMKTNFYVRKIGSTFYGTLSTKKKILLDSRSYYIKYIHK